MGDIACWMNLVLFFKIEIVSILVHMHNRGLDRGVRTYFPVVRQFIFFYEPFPKFHLDFSIRNFISSISENLLHDEFQVSIVSYFAPFSLFYLSSHPGECVTKALVSMDI